MVKTRCGAFKGAAKNTKEAFASVFNVEVSNTTSNAANAALDEERQRDSSSLVTDDTEAASKRGHDDVASATSCTLAPAEWRETSSLFGDSTESEEKYEEIDVLHKKYSECKPARKATPKGDVGMESDAVDNDCDNSYDRWMNKRRIPPGPRRSPSREIDSIRVGGAPPAEKHRTEVAYATSGSSYRTELRVPYKVGFWTPAWATMPDSGGHHKRDCQYTLFDINALDDCEDIRERRFDRSTDDRRLYFIDLFFQARYYTNRKGSRKNRDDKDALTQSWNAFVENYNKGPDDYVKRVHIMRQRFLRHSRNGKMEFIHFTCIQEGIPCGVPSHLGCPCCPRGAPRLTEEELRWYGGVDVPSKIKGLIAALNASTPSVDAFSSNEFEERYSSQTPSGGQRRQTLEPRSISKNQTLGDIPTSVPSTRYAVPSYREPSASKPSAREYIAHSPDYQSGAAGVDSSLAVVVAEHGSKLRKLERHCSGLSADMAHSMRTYRSHRDEIRDILSAHLALQQKNDLLLVDLDRLKAEMENLRASHNRLETDYKSLLGDLKKNGIRLAYASRHKTETKDKA